MEYMNAIAKMQMKAGIASRMLSHSILLTCCIMRKPTITSAGAVAKEGIVKNRGEKNRASRKSAPDAIAVRPVRPPSAIPDADSTKVVMVEVPRQAPHIVPTASERSAPLMPGSLPSSSRRLALDAQPIRVPSVSNMSTNRNANITTTKSTLRTLEKSSLKNVGATEAGMEMIPEGITL